jgi:hypothetical protein
VERIFAASTREESEAIIEQYDKYWMEIVGTRGFKGKKAKNANTMFNSLFSVDETDEEDNTDFDTTALDDLENNV